MNPLAVRAMECRIERLRRELEAAERELEGLLAQRAAEMRNAVTRELAGGDEAQP